MLMGMYLCPLLVHIINYSVYLLEEIYILAWVSVLLVLTTMGNARASKCRTSDGKDPTLFSYLKLLLLKHLIICHGVRHSFDVMAKINFPLYAIDGNRFLLNVDLRLYAKETIVASAYKYSAKYHIVQEIDKENPNIINVVFESKAGSEIGGNDVKEFCTELLDQQLRYNTEKQFGHIRDLIVEEAFKPVNK